MSVYGTIALYLNTIYTKKLLNFGFVKQMRQIRPYLETSVVIMLVALFFSWIVPNDLLSLFISTVVCVPLYFAICYYRRLYALTQAVDIIAPRLGKFGVWIKSKIS